MCVIWDDITKNNIFKVFISKHAIFLAQTENHISRKIHINVFNAFTKRGSVVVVWFSIEYSSSCIWENVRYPLFEVFDEYFLVGTFNKWKLLHKNHFEFSSFCKMFICCNQKYINSNPFPRACESQVLLNEHSSFLMRESCARKMNSLFKFSKT